MFTGFFISLSSTAIVLKLLQERAEVDTPYGRTALAILIFQDIAIVPMMLLVPLLTGATGNVTESLMMMLAKGIGIMVLVIFGARKMVPYMLYQIARTRSRELFLVSIVVICFAIAWLTSSLGLSLALGAFLAGLMISESEYSHQALGNILPFRDVFTSFFFISIGMLLNLDFLFQQSGLIALCTLGILALKTVVAGAAIMLLGFPLRAMILGGLALSQVGEFSFLLSRVGLESGLLTDHTYQLFLAITVVTMATTPFLIALGPRLADVMIRWPLPHLLTSGLYPSSLHDPIQKERLKDHLIIVGFGVNGRNVARAAGAAGIPYVIVEMNPDTVRNEQAKGEPIYFGDAIHEAVLEHIAIDEARVIVIAISDPIATRNITATARRLNPKVHIIARTRFLQEMAPLFELGANEVIPEEFETSIEIFTRVLTKYLIPKSDIERFIADVRAAGYEMLRSQTHEPASISDLKRHLADVEISTLRLDERSPMAGKTLGQTALRKKHGVTVMAIRRNAHILSNPDADTMLCGDDRLIVLGLPENIAGITGLLQPSDEGSQHL
jgi:CPA2 family monovalent cation:H+ antiporter-2